MAAVNLDRSSRLDITCRKGDTFSLTIDFNETLTDDYPANEWEMEIRDSDTGTGGPTNVHTCTIFKQMTAPLLELGSMVCSP